MAFVRVARDDIRFFVDRDFSPAVVTLKSVSYDVGLSLAWFFDDDLPRVTRNLRALEVELLCCLADVDLETRRGSWHRLFYINLSGDF